MNHSILNSLNIRNKVTIIQIQYRIKFQYFHCALMSLYKKEDNGKYSSRTIVLQNHLLFSIANHDIEHI